MDGSFVDMTTVTIKREKTRYLFRDDSFVGEIRIACLEETNTDGLQTRIEWHGNDKLQSPSFYYKGELLSAEVCGLSASLLMEEDMRSFAFLTADGRVISTSHGYCAILERAMAG